MTATLAALLFAHVLADFVFQSSTMATRKREPLVLLTHTAIVILLTHLALGRLDTPIPLAIGAAHLVIDAIKARMPASLSAFVLDQAGHVVTLVVAARLATDTFAGGLWPAPMVTVMAFATGIILATRTGGFLVAHLMARFDGPPMAQSLPDGGLWIGQLERAIIFLFVMVGEPAGIGFLIAAKSILRFDTVAGDSRAAEYVIIGTLASFGWAMAVAWGTLTFATALPPLGFLPATP